MLHSIAAFPDDDRIDPVGVLMVWDVSGGGVWCTDKVVKIVLTQDKQFQDKPLTNQAVLIAQVDDSAATSLEGLPNIALSDNTRLGPYSVLLKDAFEESQAELELSLNESTPDIVAIARSLTPEERAQGLNQQFVTREKIALIVDVNNPFQGTLTLAQVAGIFRGDITNWSQLGGSDRPLKLFHRAANHSTRLALEAYGLNTDSGALDAEQDTTAAIVDQLGLDGISYAPASETIEQFNTRVLTIDNVGVADGRYPFSQPLNYVFQAQPKPEVQNFLAFLQSPDAQAALEFAQSQPADPTRPPSQPDLSALTGQAAQVPAVDEPVASDPSSAISTPSPPPQAESPQEIQNPTTPDPPSTGDALSWLPLLLMFLVLGVLSWLTYVRLRLETKRKSAPRPAPDYAARLNAQGSNRQMDELRAIAEGPAKAKAATSPTRLATPDLSLDGVAPELEDSTDDMAATAEGDQPSTASVTTADEGLNEDLTILQTAASDRPTPLNDELEDRTTLQFVPGVDVPPGDEMSVNATADDVPAQDSRSIREMPELHAEESEDATVLQGVFEPDLPSSDESKMDEVEESLKTTNADSEEEAEEPHRDPLTGQLTDELDALSELEAAAQAAEEKRALKKAAQQSESRAAGADRAAGRWDDIADPWD